MPSQKWQTAQRKIVEQERGIRTKKAGNGGGEWKGEKRGKNIVLRHNAKTQGENGYSRFVSEKVPAGAFTHGGEMPRRNITGGPCQERGEHELRVNAGRDFKKQ